MNRVATVVCAVLACSVLPYEVHAQSTREPGRRSRESQRSGRNPAPSPEPAVQRNEQMGNVGRYWGNVSGEAISASLGNHDVLTGKAIAFNPFQTIAGLTKTSQEVLLMRFTSTNVTIQDGEREFVYDVTLDKGFEFFDAEEGVRRSLGVLEHRDGRMLLAELRPNRQGARWAALGEFKILTDQEMVETKEQISSQAKQRREAQEAFLAASPHEPLTDIDFSRYINERFIRDIYTGNFDPERGIGIQIPGQSQASLAMQAQAQRARLALFYSVYHSMYSEQCMGSYQGNAVTHTSTLAWKSTTQTGLVLEENEGTKVETKLRPEYAGAFASEEASGVGGFVNFLADPNETLDMLKDCLRWQKSFGCDSATTKRLEENLHRAISRRKSVQKDR